MTRTAAREIAIHCAYSLGFSRQSAEELLQERLDRARFLQWGEEDPLYREYPNEKQLQYIQDVVRGVAEHGPELDQYIAQMRFLDIHGIDTREQLAAYRQPLQKQIAELTRERHGLYRTQPQSPQIGQLTERLKTLRREEKLCREIAQHSAEVERRLAQAQAEKQERQKTMDEKQEDKEKPRWEMI